MGTTKLYSGRAAWVAHLFIPNTQRATTDAGVPCWYDKSTAAVKTAGTALARK